MQLIDNFLHRMMEHPLLDKLRKEARRGKEVVLYRHGVTGAVILAETNGRIVRELAVIKEFPNVSVQTMAGLVRQLRPLPGTQKAKNAVVSKAVDQQRERVRDKGRFIREHMARMRRCVKGVKKDDPSINWPVIIKGEGV